ncbi:MAG: GFA family protein [Thalassobaculaceae bacterium]|nr:GFA family protein [Thalassobaculaceae bacterium]
MTAEPIVEGGCLCGAVRYRVDGPLRETAHCHCTMCRRSSGAPAVTWTVADPNAFHWTGATPAVYRSSPGCARTFCAVCGSKLTFTDSTRPGDVDIATGGLDRPGDVMPESQIYGASRVLWLDLDPQVPFRVGDAPQDHRATSPPAEERHAGGCLCGEVRFSVTGAPARASICHCETCRRVTGGPVTGWGIWRRVAVDGLGETAVYSSSPDVTRRFCRTCGATVSFDAESDPDSIALALGLLDRPEAFIPTDQTYVDSALPGLVLSTPARRWPGAFEVGPF